MLKLTEREFKQISDLIHEKCGMFFDDRKLYFVEKRIEQRMKETAFSQFRDYYRSLKYNHNHEEMANLVESLTTNETYFYRHIPQLESFAEEALPHLLAEKKKTGDRTLNIWSAASSSGEEIYTVAIMLREHLSDFNHWRVQLLATDIDRKIIQRAKQGIYDKRSVKDVPPDVLKKYFELMNDGRFQLKQEILKSVRFDWVNLIDRDRMRKIRGMDFIFCRNVLIYFDDNARRQVIHSLYDSLNKNGFIFLGHSESVGRLSAAFKLVKFKKSLSYQKP